MSSQPNNAGSGEDCVTLGYDSSYPSLWYDRPCSNEYRFLCEKLGGKGMFNETIYAGRLQLINNSFNATQKACDCHPDGIESCNKENGQCICKPAMKGSACDACKDESYGYFPNCKACTGCSTDGTESCNEGIGLCICNPNVIGIKCDTCKDGYFGSPPNCQGLLNLHT